MNKKITLRNETYSIIGNPWWMDGRIESPIGIVVARVRAASTSVRRMDVAEELAARATGDSIYLTSPDYHGDYQTYMLDLTDADLDATGLIPEGNRPRSHADAPVSEIDYAHFMDAINNEGY